MAWTLVMVISLLRVYSSIYIHCGWCHISCSLSYPIFVFHILYPSYSIDALNSPLNCCLYWDAENQYCTSSLVINFHLKLLGHTRQFKAKQYFAKFRCHLVFSVKEQYSKDNKGVPLACSHISFCHISNNSPQTYLKKERGNFKQLNLSLILYYQMLSLCAPYLYIVTL